MCGIVGYVGRAQAAPILLDGLRRLEYRGYDSAGIAVVDEGRLETRKCAGRIAALAQLMRKEPVSGSLGVSHTRWATHGKVTDQNAHPHFDASGKLALVHNGVIENYQALKDELIQQRRYELSLRNRYRSARAFDWETLRRIVRQHRGCPGEKARLLARRSRGASPGDRHVWHRSGPCRYPGFHDRRAARKPACARRG